jgi:hypothetical protein
MAPLLNFPLFHFAFLIIRMVVYLAISQVFLLDCVQDLKVLTKPELVMKTGRQLTSNVQVHTHILNCFSFSLMLGEFHLIHQSKLKHFHMGFLFRFLLEIL